MRDFDLLKGDASTILSMCKAVTATVTAEQSAIAKIQGDKDRSQTWKVSETQAVRNASKVAGLLGDLRARHDEFRASKSYWTDPFGALRRARILPGNDEAAEATVRANLRAEVALMPLLAAVTWLQETAMRREFGRVYQGILALGDKCDLSLGSLFIPEIEVAEELFHNVEVAVRLAEIDGEGLRGGATSRSRITLGLIQQAFEQAKAQRQSGWKLTLAEKKDLGLDRSKSLAEQMNPALMNITLTNRETAGGHEGAAFAAVAPGEIPGQS